ncbi:MAG: flagellar hook assembly protein FlgD [Halomonas sp.]|uniref:flagellar hook assembly protein FlgD n=1 Tax=Halomonas sp. TaxID=1486246 RepID=UPI0028702654|nr:flagellar hook assembly protein FlgD [Halomonas sp.]MDR9440999.1 flagellar hook assembly protein FlgD [Halomonas sp.]
MSNTIDSNALNALGGASGLAGGKGDNSAEALSENFMTMMITQLQNQDPLKPMENQEMVSQLAQINTLSGIQELNETLESIGSQIDEGQALEAAGLIGQGVLVPGDRVLVGRDGEGKVNATPFGVELDEPADNVTATITDGAGQVVRRYDLGAVDAGVSSFLWEGDTDQGNLAQDGAYRVSVEATRGDDGLPASTLNYAQVNAVTPADENGRVRVDLGAIHGQASLAEIKQIL